MNNNIMNNFEKSSFSSFFSKNELEMCNKRVFRSDTVMSFSVGECYILEEGEVELIYLNKEGDKYIAAKAYPKDEIIIGSINRIARNVLAANEDEFSLLVRKGSTLIRLPSSKVKDLFETSQTFLKFSMEKDYMFFIKVLKLNLLRSAYSLDKFLAYIIYNYSNDNKYIINSVQDLSHLIKCDRTNLHTVIKKLESLKLIEKKGKTILILNKKGLFEFFDK